MTWIQTRSGKAFDLVSPRVEDVDVEDIAWALARQCRYTGHTHQHYSVAQHCCLVADALERDGYGLGSVIGGLLHDAAEAYLGDPSYPLKLAAPALADAMAALSGPIEVVICEKLGVDPVILHLPEVKDYDRRILLDEYPVVLGPCPKPWAIPGGPLGVDVEHWTATKAKGEWMDRLERLLEVPHA